MQPISMSNAEPILRLNYMYIGSTLDIVKSLGGDENAVIKQSV